MIGTWRSLVAHTLGVRGVGGSNPLVPTIPIPFPDIMKSMKTLLLTNDDGFLSPGLRNLKNVLSERYNVYVVAPDRERSAISMSLTINNPLRLNQIGEKEFSLDGTPVDCINVALREVMNQPPDFIVSGMNEGENLCEDVYFSGTVAGAFAGHLYGIPSMAVSLIDSDSGPRDPFNYQIGAYFTEKILEKLIPLQDNSVVYNLNIPPGANQESNIIITFPGFKRYKPTVETRIDPRGRKYYWIGGGNPNSEGETGSDLHVIKSGHVSLSALKYRLFDEDELKKLEHLFNGKK